MLHTYIYGVGQLWETPDKAERKDTEKIRRAIEDA